MPRPIEIRAAALDDAAALVPLLLQLGYTVAEETVRDNIRRLTHGPTDRVWVAEGKAGILGLVSAHLTPLFHAPGYLGRITSLVAHAPARGQGIGKALVHHAEAFCWAAGCERIELTSGDHRSQAHLFYEGLGFRVHSRRFVKDRPLGFPTA